MTRTCFHLLLIAGVVVFTAPSNAQEKAFSYAFLADVTCSLECQNPPQRSRSQKTIKSLQKVFNPGTLGLKKGNGGLWAPLSMGLWLFAEETCLEAARKYCGKDNISLFVPQSLKSGEWSLDQKPLCGNEKEKAQTLYSPYDKTFQNKLVKGHIMLSPSKLFEEDPSHFVITPKTSPCKNEVSADLCFGDCMSHCDDPRLQLCSPTPGATTTLKVCMDGFASLHQSSALSESELTHHCEKFLWGTLTSEKENLMLAKCASVRGQSTCAAFIKKLKNKTKNSNSYADPAHLPFSSPRERECPTCQKSH